MVEEKSVMLITLLILTADWMFGNTHFEMWRCWGRRNLTTSVRPPLISTRWRIRWLQFCQNKKIMMIISMTIKIKVIMLMSKFPGQDSDGLPEHSCSRSREKEGWTWKEVNLHTIYINRSTGLPKNYPSGNSQEQIQMIFLDHFGPLKS